MSRSRSIGAVLILLVLLVGSDQAAIAQESPWQTELRAGVALPVDDLGEIDLDPGVSLSATLAYRLTDELFVYGGWGWQLLGADDGGVVADGAIEQRGYILGLGFENPVGASKFDYRVFGAVTYEEIVIEDDDGDVLEESDHGVGFEVGTALVIPVYRQLSLTPGLRYRVLSRDLDLAGDFSSVDLSLVAAEVGVVWRFL